MPATYRISTNTVRVLPDLPFGSYEWIPYEDDAMLTYSPPVRNKDELIAACDAAIAAHFARFPNATACKAFVTVRKGERNIRGGKDFKVPLALRGTFEKADAAARAGIPA